MIGSTNRAARRGRGMRRVKTAAAAGIVAAAMATGLATPPEANAVIAADVTVDPVYTAGTLAALLNFIGNAFPGTSIGGGIYDSGPPQSLNVSIETVQSGFQILINAHLNLDYISPGDTAYLYNTLAAIPQPGCSGTYASNCRYATMLATSGATLNLATAYQTQIASVRDGVTPAGFIPFTAAPNSTEAKPTQTNQVLIFLQNPLRPNGGFYARFPDLAEFLGIDPAMPAAGTYKSADNKIALNTQTIDATWAYDPAGDFPEVFNIFAIANSLSAALPLNLAGGLASYVLADSTGKAATPTDIGLNLAALLQVTVGGLPAPIGSLTLPMTPGKGYYATLVPNQLPIFTGLRLPALAINALLGAVGAPFRLGTPLSDALEPATKILVNIAYDDVVTPEMIADDPATYGNYKPYDRTFLTSGITTPFGSVDPLTPEERAEVPGDVWHALVDGFKTQFEKPFWGIIVPADSAAPAATAVQTPRASAATPVSAAPVADASDADPVPVDAPELPAAARDTEPDRAPAVTAVTSPAPDRERVRATRSAPSARADKPVRPSAADSADADDAGAKSGASGRHRVSR